MSNSDAHKEYGLTRIKPEERSYGFVDTVWTWFGSGINTGSWFFGGMAAALGMVFVLQYSLIWLPLMMVPWAMVAYIGYQQFENYVLAPRVYRGTLQISSFAVLIAVLVGAQLLGIVGALLALPVAAAIPVVEQIWIYDRRHPREHLSSPAAWPSRDSKPEGPA